MRKDTDGPRSERWARLRFAIVGPLLATPLAPGALRAELTRLAQQRWRHPITDAPVAFGMSTIERWYYAARRAPQDPVGVLRRRRRRMPASSRAWASRSARPSARSTRPIRAGATNSTPTTSPCSCAQTPRSARCPRTPP
jgi:hypothetical protein